MHHRRHRRAKKKLEKVKRLLTEVQAPSHSQNNCLTSHDVENDILVFDGGNSDNPPILPPHGFHLHCISVLKGKHIIIINENNPYRGLTISKIHYSHPFIQMPRVESLCILGDSGGMTKIHNVLKACEMLKKNPLVGSNGKQVFGDYGRPVMYTCAGLHVSCNSCEVLDAALFMELLPLRTGMFL